MAVFRLSSVREFEVKLRQLRVDRYDLYVSPAVEDASAYEGCDVNTLIEKAKGLGHTVILIAAPKVTSRHTHYYEIECPASEAEKLINDWKSRGGFAAAALKYVIGKD